MPADSAEPGKYNSARTPYAEEILKCFTAPEVSKVVVKSASQIAKTTMLLTIVGRYVHLDPCNIMMVLPTLELAQDISKTRLTQMIRDVKELTPLFLDLDKTRKTNQTILSKFFAGGRLILVGSNSATGLASRPIRLLLCDEVDRFCKDVGGEGDAIALAEKRQSTYWNSKTGIFSTPTVEGESRIDAEYNLGTQEQWQHKCPNCGEYHFLDYRQMVTDFDERLDEYKNRNIVVKSVKWRCPDCGNEFSELEIKTAPQKYIAQNLDALKNGVRSFHIGGFSSPWVSWKTIMQEWLTARGNPAREAVVFNTRFGLSYKLQGEYQDERQFLKRLEEYPAELPDEVLLLTGGVDVQHNRLEVEICGWAADESCYGILTEKIWGSPTDYRTWEKLDAVLDREYKFSNGRGLKVARTFIDSGYATDFVYNYCAARQVKGCFPIKGKAGAGLPLIYQFGKPKNSNVILVILGVDAGKIEIFSRLAIESGAQSFHYGKDNFLKRNYDAVYFRQLISERRVVRKVGGLIVSSFETVSKGARNEALDIRNYNLAAMKSCVGNDANFWQKQASAVTGVVAQVPTKKTSNKIISRSVDIW